MVLLSLAAGCGRGEEPPRVAATPPKKDDEDATLRAIQEAQRRAAIEEESQPVIPLKGEYSLTAVAFSQELLDDRTAAEAK